MQREDICGCPWLALVRPQVSLTHFAAKGLTNLRDQSVQKSLLQYTLCRSVGLNKTELKAQIGRAHQEFFTVIFHQKMPICQTVYKTQLILKIGVKTSLEVGSDFTF